MESFRNKTSEEVAQQVKAVEEKVGHSVIPHGTDIHDPTLKERFPERYRAFVELLRSIKNPDYKNPNLDREVKNLHILSNLNECLFSAEAGEDKTLLPRQIETFEKMADFLEKGYREGHVTLPTGIGKTVIFAKFLEAVTKKTQAKALVVGPTKIILHQNKWKLDAFGEIEAGSYYGAEKDLSQQVTVTTYHSLRNGIERGDIKPDEYDVLILDEVHRALGEETTSAIESFPESTIKIGFTATPEFHEEKTVGDLLPRTIDEMSVREGIEENLLAGLKVYLVPTKKDLSKLDRSGRDYKEEELEREVNTTDRNTLIVRTYKENKIFFGKRAITYCAGRQHAKDMTAAFLAAGVSAAYVAAETGEDERGEILRKFHDGEILVLCNAKVLVEGLDEPEAEVCINAAPTMSKVIAEQRGGRILRRSQVKDRKIGHIVEIIDEFEQSENTPVLFSEIAGAAEIVPKKQVEEEEEIKKREISGREQKEVSEVQVTNDVVDDPDLIMNFTNKNAKQRYEKMFEIAPRGWKYVRELAHELNVKETEIRAYAEGNSVGEEWKKRYLTVTDILVTHYHPVLVDKIRRHFNKRLEGTITPQDFSLQHAVSEEESRRKLDAAEELGNIKAIHFEDQTYYPEKEVLEVLKKEDEIRRVMERREAEEKEAQFWEEDQLSDEERERDYWNSFESVEVEDEGSSFDDVRGERELPDTVPFDEDTSRPARWVEVEGEDNPEFSKTRLLRDVLLTLPERERYIIAQRFFENRTLENIGDEIGVTRDRVRQIEAKGLRLLRHPSRIRVIQDFQDNDPLAEESLELLQRKAKYDSELRRIQTASDSDLREAFQMFYAVFKKGTSKETDEGLYMEYFTSFIHSLLESDRQVLENLFLGLKSQDQLSTSEYWRYKFLSQTLLMKAILLRSPQNTLDLIEKEIPKSKDGKMFALYDIEKLEREIRVIHRLERMIKERQGRRKRNATMSHWLIDAKRRFAQKLPRLKELEEYRKKYNTHFPSEKKPESEEKKSAEVGM